MNGPKNEEGCSTRLKDWAHVTHPLQLVTHDELHDEKDLLLMCDGCARPIRNDGHVFYACVPCQYFLHKFCGCIMKPSRVKHRWDPHPLRLIFDPGMVEDHEHEFQYVMMNHVISTSHMSSMELLILLKTISILTASHLYSTRSFVVADNVTRLILVSLSLNVHHAKPYSVRPARKCGIRNCDVLTILVPCKYTVYY
ncbi:hypothetical protein ACET3Z_004463 [Daucus carota]